MVRVRRFVSIVVCIVLLISSGSSQGVFAAASGVVLQKHSYVHLSEGQSKDFPSSGKIIGAQTIWITDNSAVFYLKEDKIYAQNAGTTIIYKLQIAKNTVFLESVTVNISGTPADDRPKIHYGRAHTAVLRGGRVIVQGSNEHNQCNTSLWRDITHLGVGENSTAAIDIYGNLIYTGEFGSFAKKIILNDTLSTAPSVQSLSAYEENAVTHVLSLISQIDGPLPDPIFYTYAQKDIIINAYEAYSALDGAEQSQIPRNTKIKLTAAYSDVLESMDNISIVQALIEKINIPFVFAQRNTTVKNAVNRYNGILYEECEKADVPGRQILLDALDFVEQKQRQIDRINIASLEIAGNPTYDRREEARLLLDEIAGLKSDEISEIKYAAELGEALTKIEKIYSSAQTVNLHLDGVVAALENKYGKGNLTNNITLYDKEILLEAGSNMDSFAAKYGENTAAALLPNAVMIKALVERISFLEQKVSDTLAGLDTIMSSLPDIPALTDAELEQKCGYIASQLEQAWVMLGFLRQNGREHLAGESVKTRLDNVAKMITRYNISITMDSDTLLHSVFSGRDFVLPLNPPPYKIISDVLINGTSQALTENTLTIKNVSSDMNIQILLESMKSRVKISTVNALPLPGGGVFELPCGEDAAIDITPLSGFVFDSASEGNFENGKLVLENVVSDKEITIYFRPADALPLPDYDSREPSQVKHDGNAVTIEEGKVISPQTLGSVLSEAKGQGLPYVNLCTEGMIKIKVPSTANVNGQLADFVNILHLGGAIAAGTPVSAITESHEALDAENSASVTFCTPHMNFAASVDISFPAEGIDPALFEQSVKAYYIDDNGEFRENKAYTVSYSPEEKLVTIHGLTHASTYIITAQNLLTEKPRYSERDTRSYSSTIIAETPNEDIPLPPPLPPLNIEVLEESLMPKVPFAKPTVKLPIGKAPIYPRLGGTAPKTSDNILLWQAGVAVVCVTLGLMLGKIKNKGK